MVLPGTEKQQYLSLYGDLVLIEICELQPKTDNLDSEQCRLLSESKFKQIHNCSFKNISDLVFF